MRTREHDDFHAPDPAKYGELVGFTVDYAGNRGFTMRHFKWIGVFLLAVGSSFPGVPMESADGAQWKLLGGPEEEPGKKVEILNSGNQDLLLNVSKRRGHVAHNFLPVDIPALITFDLCSSFDESVEEVATELWGTGDYRISLVGTPVGTEPEALTEENLGLWEGVQFRIFPHLGESPERRYTQPGNESHTATSIWVRYANPKRLTGDAGQRHTGLQSDACQNRNKLNGTHNCGWERHALFPGGFGLADNESVNVRISISRSEAYIEANGKRFSVIPDEIRFKQLSAIVVGITNTSRGYETLEVRNLNIVSLEPHE